MFRWLKRTKQEASGALANWIGDYDLPQFASATMETLNVLRDEESELAAVAASLAVDPGLSVRVLRMVNSVGFGLRHPVDDLAHAIQLLGRADLELLLISSAVGDSLRCPESPGFDESSFWRTSAWRAVVSRAFATRLCPAERSLVFSACLLQEMAVPLLVRHRGSDYIPLLGRAEQETIPLHEIEREVLGTDHAEVAQAMCQAWELPERLAQAIGAHHANPEEVSEVPLPVLLAAHLRDREKLAGVEECQSAAETLAEMPLDESASLIDSTLDDADALAGLLR